MIPRLSTDCLAESATMFGVVFSMANLLNTSVKAAVETIPMSCYDDQDQIEEDYSACDLDLAGNETPSASNDLDYRQATFYCAVLMLCSCIVGVIGNVISILIFTRRSMRSSPINILLTVLSIVDCWVLLAAVAVFVVPGLNIYFSFMEPRALYRIIVSGFYQMGMVAQTTSVYTFVLISLERYLAVIHPFRVQQLLSARRAMMAEVLTVLTAFLYNIPRFFEYRSDDVYGYLPWLRNDPQYFAIYYTTLYLVTHFLVPFSTIAALNGFIFKTIQKSKDERQRLTGACQGSKAVSSNCNRTTRMVVIVTLIFGTCNVLPFVLNIWEAREPDLFSGERKAEAYLTLDVSNVLVVFNSSSTFIIYYFCCQRYRTLLKEGASKLLRLRKVIDGNPPSASDAPRSSGNQLNHKGNAQHSREYEKSNMEMFECGSPTTPLLHGRR